jgi:hypothetical protein
MQENKKTKNRENASFLILSYKEPHGQYCAVSSKYYSSVVDPHCFQCGSESRFSSQCGSVSSFYINAVPDPDRESQKNSDPDPVQTLK